MRFDVALDELEVAAAEASDTLDVRLRPNPTSEAKALGGLSFFGIGVEGVEIDAYAGIGGSGAAVVGGESGGWAGAEIVFRHCDDGDRPGAASNNCELRRPMRATSVPKGSWPLSGAVTSFAPRTKTKAELVRRVEGVSDAGCA